MGKKEVMNENIQPFTLNNIQIKEKIENAISYDERKYQDTDVLFANKSSIFAKLPFSDFKIAIAQEIEENKLLIQELENYDLIEDNIVEEEPEMEVQEEEVKVEEEPTIDVLDEIYDFDDEGKKPAKERYKSRIKQVDTQAIIEKIKAEAKEKNKGKKVISFRDINKELKPYLLKRNAGMGINDDALTSIDIYLNAVNKIESGNTPVANEADTPLELNLDEILNDLDK